MPGFIEFDDAVPLGVLHMVGEHRRPTSLSWAFAEDSSSGHGIRRRCCRRAPASHACRWPILSSADQKRLRAAHPGFCCSGIGPARWPGRLVVPAILCETETVVSSGVEITRRSRMPASISERIVDHRLIIDRQHVGDGEGRWPEPGAGAASEDDSFRVMVFRPPRSQRPSAGRRPANPAGRCRTPP